MSGASGTHAGRGVPKTLVRGRTVGNVHNDAKDETPAAAKCDCWRRRARNAYIYTHTLRSDDGRTPRFRDPMARLVLVSVSEKGGGGRANSVPGKNIIDYSGTRLCPPQAFPSPLPQAQCRGHYVHPG